MNMRFVLPRKLFLGLLVLSSSACSQPEKREISTQPRPVTVEASATDSAPKTDFDVKLKPIRRQSSVPALNDLYIRLLANPADGVETNTAVFDKKSFLDSIWTALKGYVFNKYETILVTLGGKIAGQDFGKRSLLMVSPISRDSPIYVDHYLTSFFRTGDSIELTWSAAKTSKVESNLVATLVAVMGEVSALYAPNGTIFKAISRSTDLSEKTRKVDETIEKIFSGEVNKSFPITSAEPAILDGFEVYVNNHSKPVVVVKFEFRESLISPDSHAKGMPSRTAEIRGKKLEGGPVIGTLIEGNQEIWGAFNEDTDTGYSKFCNKAADLLVNQGFNFVDRAAILHAYLSTSSWNTSALKRKSPDTCAVETSEGLAATSLKLKSMDEVMASAEAGRKEAKERMNARRTGIWARLSPLLAAPRADKWAEIAKEEISFVSMKYDLQLTDELELKAGIPTAMSADNVRDILHSAKLKYDKERAVREEIIEDSCYSVQSTKTSSFRGFCFYPRDGAAKMPLTIEFDFDGTFGDGDVEPKLSAMKFYPRSSGVPK